MLLKTLLMIGQPDICMYPLLIDHANSYAFCDRISCTIDHENCHNSLGSDVKIYCRINLRTSIQSLLQVTECKNVHQVDSVMLLVCHVHVYLTVIMMSHTR